MPTLLHLLSFTSFSHQKKQLYPQLFRFTEIITTIKKGEIPKDMPPKFTERIYQDVAYLIQPLQIILYNWQSLSVIYDCLKAARQLHQFVSQALPIILGTCREICGDAFSQPRLSPATQEVVRTTAERLTPALGDAAPATAALLWGARPISLLLEEYLTPPAVVGIFRQGQPHHYMLRLRNGAAGLQASYVLLQLVAPKCQAAGGPERIFVNRIRNPAKGKGKGKGKQAKGKGKGRGKQDQQAAPPNGAPPPRPTPAIAHHAAFARQDQGPLPSLPRPTPPDANMAPGEEGG